MPLLHQKRSGLTPLRAAKQAAPVVASAPEHIDIGFDALMLALPSKPVEFLLGATFIQVVVPTLAFSLGRALLLHLQGAGRIHSDEEVRAAPLPIAAPAHVALAALTVAQTMRGIFSVGLGYVNRFGVPFSPGTSFDMQQGKAIIASLSTLLAGADVLLMRMYQIGLLFTGCLLVLAWKRALLDRVCEGLQSSYDPVLQDLGASIAPASNFTSWLLMGMCALAGLEALGFNVRFLWGLGGCGGIIVGFAAQQVLGNALSGIVMFLTRPYSVGETVVCQQALMTITGQVAQINVLRTMLTTEDGTQVMVPNKMMTEMVIYNKSRFGGAKSQLLPSSGSPYAPIPMQFRVRVKGMDAGKLQDIKDDILAKVLDSPLVMARDKTPYPAVVEVLRFSEAGVDLVVRCCLKAAQRPSRSAPAGASESLLQVRAKQNQLLLWMLPRLEEMGVTLLT